MTEVKRYPSRLLLCAIILVASSPALFAAVTFTYANDMSLSHRLMLVFSLPVAAIEICVIALAFAGRISLFGIVVGWPVWARLALATLVMIAILTAATATADPVSAVIRTTIWIIHIGFGLSLFGLVRQACGQISVTVIWALLLAGLTAFAAGIAIFVAFIPNPETFKWVDFNFGVTNVRQLGFYIVAAYSIAFGLFLTTQNKRVKTVAMLAAPVFIAIILWSGTRSGILGIVFSLVLVCLTLRLARTRAGLIFVPLTMLIALPLSQIHVAPEPQMGIGRMWSDTNRESLVAKSGNRVALWKGALKMMPARLLTGYGESQFRLLVPENKGVVNHPHNSIIQIIFQWGLVGASCFFALFGFAWFQLWRVAKQMPEAGVPAYLVVSSLFGFSLVEGSLYHTWPVMIMAGVTAIALGARSAALKPAAPMG